MICLSFLQRAARALRTVALFASFATVCLPGHAVTVTGTFAGMSTYTDHFPSLGGLPVSTTTSAVSGGFSFDLERFVDWQGEPVDASFGSIYPTFSASVDLRNAAGWSRTSDGATAFVTVNRSSQNGYDVLSLGFNESIYDGMALNLAGTAGTFDDPFHFDPSRLVASASGVEYFGHWSRGSVAIDSLNVTAPVPEPGTYLLMLAGLGGIATVTKRRREAARAPR